MAFENVTLFEIHLDDAKFGTNDQHEAPPEPAGGGSGAGRAIALVLLSVALAVGATLAARALLGEGAADEREA